MQNELQAALPQPQDPTRTGDPNRTMLVQTQPNYAGSAGTRTVGVWGARPPNIMPPIVLGEGGAATEQGKTRIGGPHAPVRARLSLLPSGPGEVHEMNAAWGPWSV